jgi:DNA-binding NarL/FixJ family response regulator
MTPLPSTAVTGLPETKSRRAAYYEQGPTLRPPITVWLVEDHTNYRETVQALLNGEPGMGCPLTFADCESMIEVLHTVAPPEVVLMDIEIPGRMSGIAGVQVLRKVAPETRAVMLTIHSDDDKIFHAVCAGASGYLLKLAEAGDIVDAVVAAHNGGVVMSPQIARRVLEIFRRFAVPSEDYDLTAREKEVLGLLVQGLKKQEIADRLFLAFCTIDSHMRSIYEKLHVHSRTEAVVKALKERLI